MLGLKRRTVQVIPHHPEWRQLFEDERRDIFDRIGELVLAVEHVGSTAVFGLVARPIIDIAIAVSDTIEEVLEREPKGSAYPKSGSVK